MVRESVFSLRHGCGIAAASTPGELRLLFPRDSSTLSAWMSPGVSVDEHMLAGVHHSPGKFRPPHQSPCMTVRYPHLGWQGFRVFDEVLLIQTVEIQRQYVWASLSAPQRMQPKRREHVVVGQFGRSRPGCLPRDLSLRN